jgi:hypothetical protein
MNPVVEFSRYVGLVVLVTTTVLLAPRATVGIWGAAGRWLRERWETARRGPVCHPTVPVEIRVPRTRARPHGDVELLEPSYRSLPLVAEISRMRSLLIDLVESRALVLAGSGLLLRHLGEVVAQLPKAVVMTGDLLLVLATFLVMRSVIRDYPQEYLPRRAPAQPRRRVGARPDVGTAVGVQNPAVLLLMALGLVVLLAWPSQLGQQVAASRFSAAEVGRAGPLVALACELNWLLLVTWALTPKRLRRAPQAPQHAAVLLALPARAARPPQPAWEQQAS